MLCAGDENYILSRKHYKEVFRLLVEVKEKYGIVSNPTAVMTVFELVSQSLSPE